MGQQKHEQSRGAEEGWKKYSEQTRYKNKMSYKNGQEKVNYDYYLS